jgi:5,5'-dehydrodivanillate O-demethylase
MLNEPSPTCKDKISITAYDVQDLSGVVFAYIGPQPTPLLPRWEQGRGRTSLVG